jgi:acyl-homoserine-lactone acylase
VRQIEAGYVRAYNRYLASVGGASGIPDPACRGQAWVKPITVQDSSRRASAQTSLFGVHDSAIAPQFEGCQNGGSSALLSCQVGIRLTADSAWTRCKAGVSLSAK